MKITQEQRNAASTYWTQILIGEFLPAAFQTARHLRPPFLAPLTMNNRFLQLNELNQNDPLWPLRFSAELNKLLMDVDNSEHLELEYGPQGLLKQALINAGLSETLFPVGKLRMSFDSENNLIVGDEKIDINQYIESFTSSLKL